MQFDELTYNVTIVPANKLVIDYFPILKEYWEFENKKNDTLLRVAILATDQKSPFVKLEREDYEKRLTKVFEYLNIKDQKLISDLSLGYNSDYEKMLNRLYMLSDNLAYVMWSNKLRMFHYISMSLRQPPNMDNIVGDMTKRASLDKQLKEIYNDLSDYEALIFTDVPTRTKIRKQISKLLQPAEQYSVEKQVI